MAAEKLRTGERDQAEAAERGERRDQRETAGGLMPGHPANQADIAGGLRRPGTVMFPLISSR